ncbi:NAD(P)/FAD-dependent oxidoreductase [Rubritalea tangerina]|uniref:NAD(P)/FAD-dependent oxidoreductase n=1 Tax=Rubritalea tangerina TaxID=430798 RepID=A0ABW4ZE56_9BACT
MPINRASTMNSPNTSNHAKPETNPLSIAIVGGGPAGLRAAEVAASSGAQVTLYEAKRSVGRKFLVAGKSGLNLTNGESFPSFLDHYQGPDIPSFFYQALKDFDNQALRHWAAELGIETYVASSNKVFPVGMKAAPLLRRWIEKLRTLGVHFRVRHTLTQITTTPELTLHFNHDGETLSQNHDRIILALGGGSWPSTGSDGSWVQMLNALGLHITPLTAANCGWETLWPEALLNEAEGLPLKNIVVHAGDRSMHGELVITRYGLEGGPIYRLGPAIKAHASPHISIDFKPTFTTDQLVKKMESAKRNYLQEARTRWKLNPAAAAILENLHGPFSSTAELARHTKSCHIPLTRPRPIEEAISSAGGITWDNFNQSFELQSHPGIFLAGEMLDWEAPTGGFLLQSAFATGNAAAHQALNK